MTAIVVTINSIADIARNLAELRMQEGVELEIVAVDNGSTDGTEELLAAQRDVHLIANRRNLWLSPAWAQGVRASTRPLLLFLAPDTSLLRPDAVVGLAQALESRPSAGLAGPVLLDEEGADRGNGAYALPSVRWLILSSIGAARRLGRTAPAKPLPRGGPPRPVAFVNGACMLVRRTALEQISGLDERFQLYWEEIDLARRLRDAGWEILLVPDVEAVHRGKGTPAPAGLRRDAYAHGERLYLRKHHGRAAEPAVRAARLIGRLLRVER